jgi:hypothetical protein
VRSVVVVLGFGVVAAPAGSTWTAAKPPRPAVLKFAAPQRGHVTAAVLLFKRQAGSKPPKVSFVGRPKAQASSVYAVGVGRWAYSQTQWVALVAFVNFKPLPPPGGGPPPTGRTLASANATPAVRVSAERPFSVSFRGDVPLATPRAKAVIKSFKWDVVRTRPAGKAVPAEFRQPANVLDEVKRALAGIPNPQFADAVLGRVPVPPAPPPPAG